MGANNSKPQTVQISNAAPLQISREVLERVEKATNTERSPSPTVNDNCNCSKPVSEVQPAEIMPHADKSEKVVEIKLCNQEHQQENQLVSVPSTWTRRSTEIEETQFNKTLDRVHNLFGQPVKWAKANECSNDIDTMEKELISCYRQYGAEPLKCSRLAQQYHSYVFNKQLEALKKTKSVGQNMQQTNVN